MGFGSETGTLVHPLCSLPCTPLSEGKEREGGRREKGREKGEEEGGRIVISSYIHHDSVCFCPCTRP